MCIRDRGYSDEVKANALASIKRYNEFAKAGKDDEFHVNPEVLYPIETSPFYGSKVTGATFLTVCGGCLLYTSRCV